MRYRFTARVAAGLLLAVLAVNMPAPGCWTLHLSWGGHSDQLSLRYVR